MKKFYLILVMLLLLVAVGFALPFLIPGCTCGYPEAPCKGCGGVVGNSLGNFSGVASIYGAIGFVLLIWFGPIFVILVVLFLLARKIYRWMTGVDSESTDQENSLTAVLRDVEEKEKNSNK